MKKWLCVICGLIYNEAEGWPDDGIAPGTRWEDVPDDWTCPDCGVGKEDFEMIEVTAEEPDNQPEAVPQSPSTETTTQTAVSVETTDSANSDQRLVIIGTGYAGYGLAQSVRRQNEQIDIVMFTHDSGDNYSKPGLSNAMARDKTPDELVSKTAEEMAQQLNVTVHTACQVHRIDPERYVVMSDQGELSYSKLVLATGANPFVLPLAGEGAADIVSVNSLAQYRVFCDRLAAAAGKRVSIIGNGLVGCEFANELAAQGYEVTVVGLTHWPLDPLLPEAIGRNLQDKLSALGVNWYLGNTVQSVDKAGGSYQLTLEEGQVLEADLVLSAVGLRADSELAKQAGIDCQRGIVVDECLQTSVADVYALGDCAEINGQVLPYIAPITHGLTALTDNVLGGQTQVSFPLMPVVVKTPALPLLMVPPERGAEGEWQVDVNEDGARGVFRDAQQNVLGFVLGGGLQSERQQWLDAMKAVG